MRNVVIASKNPIKTQAVEAGFSRIFPAESFHFVDISTSSQVSDQPASDQETLQGAQNRARNAQRELPAADFWVGIEGGIQDTGSEMTAFAWVVVLSNDLNGKGRTGTFYLPPRIAALVRDGKELGEADDIVFERTNSKQDLGAVGLLTGGVIDRRKLYEGAVILALIPFNKPELYKTNAA